MFENRLHTGLSLNMCLKRCDDLGLCCKCACKLTIRKDMYNACIIYATLAFDKEKEKTLTCLQLQIMLSLTKGGITILSVVCRGKSSLCEGHVINTDFRTTKTSLSE